MADEMRFAASNVRAASCRTPGTGLWRRIHRPLLSWLQISSPNGLPGPPRCVRTHIDSHRAKCVRILCQNYVATPANPRHTQWFIGTHRCTSMLREVVDRNCVGGIWCASTRVDGVAFQACSGSPQTHPVQNRMLTVVNRRFAVATDFYREREWQEFQYFSQDQRNLTNISSLYSII
jgi:hypothetical protein